MLQNKAGKLNASSLPSSGNVIAYSKGDILVGNIRLEWALITFFLTLEIFKPLRCLGEVLENGIMDSKKVENVLLI